MYVNQFAQGENDGSSWTNAFVNLQDGIKSANYGDNIWVAKGVYHPTDVADREISFKIKNGIKIYGGFSGAEESLVERDWEANTTNLSGDIGIKGDSLDNSIHVVDIDSADINTLIDGFVISHGYAIKDDKDRRDGGAIDIDVSNASILNCVFTGNYAHRGGAVSLYKSNSIFYNCKFIDNRAGVSGGAFVSGYGTPEFKNCLFERNISGDYGGAGSVSQSDIIFDNCQFIRNFIDPNSNISRAFYIGGALRIYWSRPIIKGCLFLENFARNESGAIDAGYYASMKVENSKFIGNYTAYGKNAIRIWNYAGPTFSNSLFNNNSIRVTKYESSYSIFNNCTFFKAGLNFSKSYDPKGKSSIINNSILWDTPISNYNNEVKIRLFNNILNSPINGPAETKDNVNADPLLTDTDGVDGITGNEDDDFSLTVSSPAINGGSVLLPEFTKTPFDLAQNPRILGGIIDIGAYEGAFISKFISGTVYNDKNKNCVKDRDEEGIKNIIVGTENLQFYTLTNENGSYALTVDEGIYEIAARKAGDDKEMFEPNCKISHSVDLVSNDRVDNINFSFEKKGCKFLSVSVESEPKRRCFTSKTYILVKNHSDTIVENPKVFVQYPDFIIPVSSHRRLTKLENNVYEFSFSNTKMVPGGEYKSYIIDSVLCGDESIRGNTQCIKAWVEPTYACIEPGKGWDNSDLAVAGICNSDEVIEFTISNKGESMQDSSEFRIFENGRLGYINKLKLEKGDSVNFTMKPAGKTYRVEVDQANGHPVGRWNQSTVEVCGKNENGEYDLGFVSVLAAADIKAWNDEVCNVIVDSVDPNDKAVKPSGFGEDHIVQPETTLKYTIRYQNTGTAPARNITLVDTLSEKLDVTTLSHIVSSDYFNWDIFPGKRTVVVFKSVHANLLPASEDEVRSQGFLSFSISPKNDVTLRSTIENTADIYFDYNSPIATNTVSIMIDVIKLEKDIQIDNLHFLCENSTHTKSDTTVLCGNDVITLSSDEYPPGGIFSGAGVTGDQFKSTDAGGEGVYEITYSYDQLNYCPKRYKQFIRVAECEEVMGINSLEKEIKIFPIPTHSQLCINAENIELKTADVTLKNLTGAVVYRQKLNLEKGEVKCLDLLAIPSGVYVLSLVHHKENLNRFIILSR